jgi:glycosyltransferase involved in cell wall biosynthesis
MAEPVAVSIIIPVYNLEKILSNCLLSCINQTFKKIEIIIINDGSEDKTNDIISEFKKNDNRIISISKQNEGLTYARKTGVENAKGEYIFHLDGDDHIPNDAIENLYTAAKLNDADIVVGDFALFYKEGLHEIRTYSLNSVSLGAKFLEYILENKLHYLCGKLIKRKLYNENDIEIKKEVSIGEDQVQMIQLCMLANLVAGINRVVYNYILLDESITHRKRTNQEYSYHEEQYAEALFSIKYRFQYNDIIRQQINFRIISALYRSLHHTGYFAGEKKELKRIFYKTLINSVFSSKTMFFKHFPLIIRCLMSLIFPSSPYYISRLVK